MPGTAAPVNINFLDTAGSVCGALFPTGNLVDRFDGVEVTCIDNGMPVVVMLASDLGVTGSEARYLLWLLTQVADRGKLDRFIGQTPVMHKAGWLEGARHDNGIVAFWSGAYVATVMTWRTSSAENR